MKKKLSCYLRSNRRRWGLTQKELAVLLGTKTGGAISRIESGDRLPTFTTALACQVLFDLAPCDIFPGAFTRIEEDAITRAYDLYERLQGTPSTLNRIKLDFLEQAISRATARLKNQEA